MEMGVLKPFEVTSTARAGVSVEAGSVGRAAGKQTDVASAISSNKTDEATRSSLTDQPVEADREAIDAAVSDMQNFVQSVQRDINFNVDDSSGRVVINVTEATSGEVIRQIPSEEALRLSESLSEIRSLLFKAEA
ncbi:flagellar protein FlaG [Halopseudomonas salina]|uniref:Flagellar protein FlaG n=1 Tax=Halopseudomonas salina TaxID=1323744 RepID=A0ABQ1PLA8_9GAMM|nr:flagellar protein FlaG [Halopseudomonas salina]GGC99222.1 hypothetical protein GCM10007418_18100 [Halopseudomonas salina]